MPCRSIDRTGWLFLRQFTTVETAVTSPDKAERTIELTPQNHKQKPMHATGFGLEHCAPARSPMANGSTRMKGSALPSKEHYREEHSENAIFLRKTQRNVAKSGGGMTDDGGPDPKTWLPKACVPPLPPAGSGDSRRHNYSIFMEISTVHGQERRECGVANRRVVDRSYRPTRRAWRTDLAHLFRWANQL